MRLSLLAVLFIGVAARAADNVNEFYPTAIGSKWTFSLGKQDEKFVWSAVKLDKVGAQECVVFEGALKGQVVGSEHVAVVKDGVFRYKMGDNLISPPICFLKADAKGKTWEEKFKVGDVETTAKYSADVEDVDVPAGKYKGAIVIRTEASEKDVKVKSAIWYVKDVGMVKQAFELGNVKYELLLEKFEPAAKK
jgi:hypothetical protein